MFPEDLDRFDREAALTERNKRRLKALLMRYVTESLPVLERGFEWPRPLSARLDLSRLGLGLFQELFESDTLTELHTFLHETGLRALIASTGHGWFDRSSLPEAFLEHYAERVRTRSSEADAEVCERLLRDVWHEISRTTVHLRRVIAFTGPPLPRAPRRVSSGMAVRAYDINTSRAGLAELLDVDHQRRFFRVWPIGTGVLVSHDITFRREPDSRQIFRVFEVLNQRSQQISLAIKLATERSVLVESIHTAQISRFPLFDMEEQLVTARGLSFPMFPPIWASSFDRRLNSIMTALSNSDSQSIEAILARFRDAFRAVDESANIIDLMVCLEGLLDVTGSELKSRLATRLAALLGENDEQQADLYASAVCAYEIRNALVHSSGKSSPDKRSRTKLKKSRYADSADAASLDEALAPLVGTLRKDIRRALLARVLRPQDWPSSDQWEALVLNRRMQRDTRRALRLLQPRRVTTLHA
ncbi:MAG: hypothetical protein ACYDEB_14300 [Dehalococcoidia bacterium]